MPNLPEIRIIISGFSKKYYPEFSLFSLALLCISTLLNFSRVPPRERVTFWTARKSPKSRQGVAAIGRPRLPPCHPPPGPLFTGVIPFELRHNRREEICVAGPVPLRARGPGEWKISVCVPLGVRLVLGSQLTKQKPAPAVLAAKTRRRCGIAEAEILGCRGPQARGKRCQRADFSRRLCWTHKRRTPP